MKQQETRTGPKEFKVRLHHAILESLQWNISKMEQFSFRFIRFDSKEFTHVHFVLYEDSIKQNLMALVLTKERLYQNGRG